MTTELRPYQIKVLEELEARLAAGEKRVVISSCPGSGKTLIAIEFMRCHPDKTFLVLTHGQVSLRKQWGKDFEIEGVEASLTDDTCRIYYGIPQGVKNRKPRHFDYIIVDEAHHFYLAKDGEVKSLEKRSTPVATICLTGTPSKFIALGDKPIVVPAMDLVLEGKYLSDLYFGVFSTTAKLEEDNYTRGEEVSDGGKNKLEASVGADLENLCKALLDRLTGVAKDKAEFRKTWASHAVNGGLGWLLGGLDKTMIACASIPQAREITRILRKQGVRTVMSHSKTEDGDADVTSGNLNRFQKDDDIKVLVVVNRAILGFNMIDLVNIVDLSGSRNIDRIYQLYARAMRKSVKHSQKFFFKAVADADLGAMDLGKFYLNAAICLMQPGFISSYNGKNLGTLEVYTEGGSRKRRKPGDGGGDGGEKVRPVIDRALFEHVQGCAWLQDIESKIRQPLNEFAKTTFGKIRSDLLGISEAWTIDTCMDQFKEDKINGMSRTDSQSVHAGCFMAFWRRLDGTLEQLRSIWPTAGHIDPTSKKAELLAIAASGAAKPKKNTPLGKSLYHYCWIAGSSFDLKFCNEIKKLAPHWKIHSKNGQQIVWTYESVREEAKKYDTRSEFARSSPGAYAWAKRLGIMDEICHHMIPVRKMPPEQEIFAFAQECRSLQEFRKRFSRHYNATHVLGIMGQVSEKMGWNNMIAQANSKEQELLALIRDPNGTKPVRGTSLHAALINYTSAGGSSFRPHVLLELKALKPYWRPGTNATRKTAIVAMKNGVIHFFDSQRQCRETIAVNPTHALNGRASHAGGFTFRYATEEEIRAHKESQTKGESE